MIDAARRTGRAPHGPRWTSIRRRFGVVAVVGLFGMAIAMGQATGFWWWEASASALGTDPTGGVYFNLTMMLLGVTFIAVAAVMNDLLRDAAAAGLAQRWWATASRVGIWLIPPAFVLVGLFRIDEGSRASRIHDVAGFTIPLVVMAMMLTAGWGMPGSFPRFSARALAILGAIVLLFIVSVLGLVSYALMEMLAFVICWWWLLGLATRIDRRLGGVPESEIAPIPEAAA